MKYFIHVLYFLLGAVIIGGFIGFIILLAVNVNAAIFVLGIVTFCVFSYFVGRAILEDG